jgi:hypothetical protein
MARPCFGIGRLARNASDSATRDRLRLKIFRHHGNTHGTMVFGDSDLPKIERKELFQTSTHAHAGRETMR